MSYVAAKLCHFKHLTTRARHSEATAACPSVQSVIIAPEPKTKGDEHELIAAASAQLYRASADSVILKTEIPHGVWVEQVAAIEDQRSVHQTSHF
jgi:hypothetical protein